MKLLSVVIPFFNTDIGMFEKCLSTLQCDRAEEIEVVVVDDGSFPESKRALERAVASSTVDALVLHKENGGQNSARVLGLSFARGEYVFFLDSDDYVDTEALGEAIDVLDKKKPKIMAFNYDVVDTKGDLIERHDRWPNGYRSMDIAKGIIHSESLWMQFYRRDLIFDLGNLFAQGIRIGEDLASAIRILLSVGEASTAGISLYRYVKRPGSALSAPSSESMLDIIEALEWVLGLPEAKIAPYRTEVEWVAILHVLYWGGVRLIRACGPDANRKDSLFHWMDSKFPSWRGNPYLKNERIVAKSEFRLVVSGRWREYCMLVALKQRVKRLMGMAKR